MNKLKGIFFNYRKELRIGWKIASGIGVCVGTLLGVIALMGFAFGRLFEVWGLTNENLIYAPGYAQQIVFWHTDFTYALAYAASLTVGMVLAGRWTRPAAHDGKMIGLGALAGIGCGAVLTVAALALDSMRLEWPLGEISLSLSLIPAIIVQALACLCREVLSKRLIFDPLKIRFGRLAGYAGVCMLAAFANPTPLGILNGMLMGIVGCVLYERGGIFASSALRFGWLAWTNLLFAWPDTVHAPMYKMYTVSEAWLTGGNAGAETGLGCTVIWLVMALILLRREIALMISKNKRRRSTDEEDSHSNRRLRFPRQLLR